MVQPPTRLGTFESFVEIVEALRGPDGCPWDKEQTHKTLAPYAIEEAHELAEAMEAGDTKEMVGELGDVLLQVVLNSVIARQDGTFTLEDVLREISEKMIRRHPHVFANTTVQSSKDVLHNWSEIKAEEKAKAGKTSNSFDLPKALPALQRAHKIGDKTAKIGFDWPDAQGVFEKLEEEMRELKDELSRPSRDSHALEHEIGDVLFSAAQLARHLGLDAEQSLRVANNRFESRYLKMRETVGDRWTSLTDTEKESAWQQAKRELAEKENRR